MKFQLGLLSKWRSELMGLAAIFIIVCHMPAHGVQMPHVISKLIQYGGLGAVGILASCFKLPNKVVEKKLKDNKQIYSVIENYVREIANIIKNGINIIKPISRCI